MLQSDRLEQASLISPYGGALVDLLAPSPANQDLRRRAGELPFLILTDRTVCDLELLATGAFSPLDRFMGEADYARTVAEMRLADGRLFPIPVTLPVEFDAPVALDRDVALRDNRGRLLAMMTVEEIYSWDRREFAAAVLGTEDPVHPLVRELATWGPLNITGPLRVLQLPVRGDFRELRLTPLETRGRLQALGRSRVVAFQTRNPLHRVHEELTKCAFTSADASLLLHPTVGVTCPGDVDYCTRVHTYQAVMPYYEPQRALLALLPLAMRMAGPREAVWHALIRRNFGATHFIVGRDHAGPGKNAAGRPFYAPYAAQDLVEAHSAELGITMIPFRELTYLPAEDRYVDVTDASPGSATLQLSGTQVRDYLDQGRPLPPWFTRPEVAAILADAYRRRERQGVCVWFTGLSGAGKSTIADVLAGLVREAGREVVTVLDGDAVRAILSKDLGFSKEDRDLNIRRIGFIASEVVRHGGVVICAAISPYRTARDEVRAMMPHGRFIEVYVDTPIAVCEARDTKGLYARARRGQVKGVTGIDDPYEPPTDPELTLRADGSSPAQCAEMILERLHHDGVVLDLAQKIVHSSEIGSSHDESS